MAAALPTKGRFVCMQSIYRTGPRAPSTSGGTGRHCSAAVRADQASPEASSDTLQHLSNRAREEAFESKDHTAAHVAAITLVLSLLRLKAMRTLTRDQSDSRHSDVDFYNICCPHLRFEPPSLAVGNDRKGPALPTARCSSCQHMTSGNRN